jgi:hypothetical protein
LRASIPQLPPILSAVVKVRGSLLANINKPKFLGAGIFMPNPATKNDGQKFAGRTERQFGAALIPIWVFW